MSAGAVFKLIANDGKADRMIMATKLINQRIKDVMCARSNAGRADITPTLVDLERTHILYVNAHFKPFAAIGYEYNKVRPQSGNPILGGGVTFSIPQYGDFFYDMVVRTRLGGFSGNVGYTPLQSLGTPSAPAVFPLDGTSATGVTVGYENYHYNIVDGTGTVIVAGSDDTAADPVLYRNFVRYCEYPGDRLFNLVKFDVNGNPLDQYDAMVPTFLNKFCTPPNKRVGLDRLIGQEIPLQGYGGLPLYSTVVNADAANTPAGIGKQNSGQSNLTVGLYNVPAGQVLPVINGLSSSALTGLSNLDAVGGPQVDISRQLIEVVNGPQTAKPVQPPLEIWNKLRFWFNDDVRLSIPSVSIPFGQRFISIDLATQAQLCFESPSIYLQTIVDSVADPTHNIADNRVVTYSEIFQLLGFTDITVEKIEMYINNIFVNPEIHDIYIKRIGFTLIRVYRQQQQQVNQEGQDEKLLSQIKWPVEYMFLGFRPNWNVKNVAAGAGGVVASGNQNVWRDWHRMTFQVDALSAEIDYAQMPSGANIAAIGSRIDHVIPYHYWLPVSTVNEMTLTSHGIVIYDHFQDLMYNAYMPFNYGGGMLCTPMDTGALMINMALYPRAYQPSGHLNISRARETYVSWSTSYISSSSPATMIIVAVTINFLLITDGSAVLRYST